MMEWTYFSYSESLKIRSVSRSTMTLKPASMSRFDVVGVSAARRSNCFFSHRNHRVGAQEDILQGGHKQLSQVGNFTQLLM